MNVGLPIVLFICVRGLAHCNQVESLQASWYITLSWSSVNVVHVCYWDYRSSHSSCVLYVFVCVCVCVCGVRALADHKSTADNIYRLKFVTNNNNNNNNIVLKLRISKINF